MTYKRTLAVFSMIGAFAIGATAQSYNVETVKESWEYDANSDVTPEMRHQRIAEAVMTIEEAAKHPKTANDYKMWYYKGLTYLYLHNEGSEAQKAQHPDALAIATKCFYNSINTDVKGKIVKDAKANLTRCAIGHYNNAVMAFNDKKYDEAIKSYQTVLDIFPMDEEEMLKKQAQINPQNIKLFMSFAASMSGDKELAKKLLQELIDANYGDPRIYSDMANIYLDEKDTTKALEYIAIGREMDETNVNLMRAELDLYLRLGRSQELVDKLNEAIETEPESVVLHFARAINYYNLADHEAKSEKPDAAVVADYLDKAEAGYLKVIELDNGYADAYFNLGVIYLDRCKPIAAEISEITDYDKTLPLEAKIDKLYAKATEQFESALEVGTYSDAQKLDLLENLKKLYGRLQANDKTGEYLKKYKATKDRIDAIEG